ncbi:hypothetical protein SKAU_G00216420 [Synaphobranchus kaupii]|uniref:Endonuclease-reverse transcriptase n=1 Tax=Synaphobranchus kaupii TaxID=118154 RepID=A0A9Q1ITF2_SYNKA|nr:hypothetical protein SKAU_G00216420 [Synaphobranchus kaupii]
MTSGKSKTKRKINIKDTGGVTLSQVEDFVYLRCTVDGTGGSEKAVRDRLKAGRKKWREVTGVTYDKTLPLKLRIKVYKTVIRPVLLYGAETWAMKKKEERLLMRSEMKMLRWIMGISLREKKTNKSIKEMAGVVGIEEKAREARTFQQTLDSESEERSETVIRSSKIAHPARVIGEHLCTFN